MKKYIQILFLLGMVVSGAIAQKTTTADTKIYKQVNVGTAEKVLVTSINESFEGTFPPSGWTLYSPDMGSGWSGQTVGTAIPGSPEGHITGTPNGQGGSKLAFCSWYTGGSVFSNQWMITPQITVSANYNLFFYVRKYGAYTDQLSIKISTTTNVITAFTDNLANIYWLESDTGWTTKVFSLSAYAGQNIYIAFNEHVVDNTVEGAPMFIDLVKVDLNAGIPDVTNDVSLKLYPNPVKTILNIESASNINRIKISNLLGQLLLDEKTDDTKSQVNTSDFEAGVYFVTLETEKGVLTRKINISK